MPNSKQIVYLSQAQYAELITNGTITVDGVTVTYDENDIYVTPQAEPVTDVRVAGTSVAANGVATIPTAGDNTFGAVKVATGGYYGIKYYNNNNDQYKFLVIQPSASNDVKNGVLGYQPIVPDTQHAAAFYGLAKAAGHDEKNSAEPLGTYTPEAKGAIQSMLGVSDLIATAENDLVASKAYAIGDVFTANGKLYKATAAIAADAAIIPAVEGEEVSGANCEETNVGEGFVKKTDYASSGEKATAGLVWDHNGAWGIKILTAAGYEGALTINSASSLVVKNGDNNSLPITSLRQHESVFYGLAKAAGDTTQAASNNAVGTYTDEAKAAIRTMVGAVGSEDYATTNIGGVVKVTSTYGLQMLSNGNIIVNKAGNSIIKSGSNNYTPIVPTNQHIAVFYGLAKASGDTTQSASSNAVGVYTDNAKASIKSMLGIVDGSTGTVDVTSTTPTITAVENTRYVCGEVTSLNFTPPASGICIVRFTSGSTVTVLTLPSTVKFPEWFDPATLETNTIYEICITDGVYGAVMSWAQ